MSKLMFGTIILQKVYNMLHQCESMDFSDKALQPMVTLK